MKSEPRRPSVARVTGRVERCRWRFSSFWLREPALGVNSSSPEPAASTSQSKPGPSQRSRWRPCGGSRTDGSVEPLESVVSLSSSGQGDACVGQSIEARPLAAREPTSSRPGIHHASAMRMPSPTRAVMARALHGVGRWPTQNSPNASRLVTLAPQSATTARRHACRKKTSR